MTESLEQWLQPARLWSRMEILTRPCPLPRAPGAYAWYFELGSLPVPEDNCHVFDGRVLLYVGISPKPPSANGAPPSKQTVAHRLRYHYRGNAAGSTLRLTLGCLLAHKLGIELRRVGSGARMTFGSGGESRLSTWMGMFTRIACVACETPWQAEERLIETLSPPLNLDQNRVQKFHASLSEMRRHARERARKMPVLT